MLALKITLFFIFIAYSPVGFAIIYNRPIPYPIRSLDPIEALDHVSFGVVPLAHKALFKIDHKNGIVPILVENFFVSNDQLSYHIILKNLKFHSGKPLYPSDVKFSIERVIRKRSKDYQKLLNIRGALEFQNNSKADIEGIQISKNKIQINLLKPDSNFLYALADQRLSIVNIKDGEIDGLGDFSPFVEEKSYVFKKTANFESSNQISEVRFRVLDPVEAIKYFKKGEVDDLFYYSLSKKEVDELKEIGHIFNYTYPKTYAFFINGLSLNRRERLDYFPLFKELDIGASCFRDDTRAKSLIPEGYLGGELHFNENITKKWECNNKQSLTIFIPRNLKNEKCVVEKIKKTIDKCNSISLLNKDFGELVPLWLSGKVSIYLGFIEAESSADYLPYFLPSSSFSLGEKEDKFLEEKYREYLKIFKTEKSVAKYNEMINHIYNNYTVYPIAHEKIRIVYSTRYKKIDIGFRSLQMISLDEFQLEKK